MATTMSDLIDVLLADRIELQPRENFPRNPTVPDGWWDHTSQWQERRDAETTAKNIAKDVARGFSPTTQMPSGGGTPSSPSRPTGPRGGGAGGRKTRPAAPTSPAKPSLSQILTELALSPYQKDLAVTGKTERPKEPHTPPTGIFGGDGLIQLLIDDLRGPFGYGPQATQYDYQTEPVYKSPLAEIAHNYYNPYGVLFSDPVRTDTYPYYAPRPEMIPTMHPNNTRSGYWGGY